ncbi:MAG: RNA methyltransferase [Clostridia bacterium]|nr:RNA methyltransferase [Clostridia bacterium]
MITSKDNAKIKRVAALMGSAKKRRDEGVFLLEGTRLCAEALREDIEVLELYYTPNLLKSDAALIKELSAISQLCEEVNDAVFAKMSDTCSPQGVLLVARFSKAIAPPQSGRLLAFERVQDPSNLGAASRTAEALGFSGIILSGESTDPFSPKSLRASMGALLRIPIIHTSDFLKTITEYKNRGFKVSGTVVDADATPINTVKFTENEIAVIGNEASGMTDAARSVCNRLVTIPMAGRAESLNAGVAAAIVMWEMCR